MKIYTYSNVERLSVGNFSTKVFLIRSTSPSMSLFFHFLNIANIPPGVLQSK